MLVLNAIIKEEPNVESGADRRRSANRILAEYRDEAGDVFRK
jgi:hypothetical protein